ncbi:MAG TPA: magnesium/cobalt transporter CorA [Daejeonella sp.]|nr:magnesium/cobalt transporter CorA [Daejeonella sp.]
MSKIRRIKVKPAKRYDSLTGAAPGYIQITEGALKPQINIHSYNSSQYLSREIGGPADLEEHLNQYSDLFHWIDIRGLGDLSLLQYIEQKFRIHKLVMEDIANTRQRPKLDEYGEYLFATSRMLYINNNLEIENDQISFLLTSKVLISFQENYTRQIDPILQRLERGKGNIYSGGPSYMMYALMDIIIDNYFELIYKLGEELETIEELLYRRPEKSLMYATQTIKRAMILIRRAAWPERDKINELLRSETVLIAADTKPFLRDAYDHCMQVIDLVENYKDITSSLIDMNLSFISNRMNEIMKVLTIISSIFIPLTFIAGIYGMNFSYQDPETGKILHRNMPELYAENGYVYVMLIMLLIAVLQIIYFWRKGWLSNR